MLHNSFVNRSSKLKENPKSQVIEEGYINIYSELSDKERRQIEFKRRYKRENPEWEESQVYLSKKFGNLVQDDLVVLDAGCGHGNYVIDENRRKIDWAVGVDACDEATSKNICLDEIKHADLENIPFEDNFFDACVSLWVLEHLSNPKRVFEEISRVLKPEGYLFFVAPNKNYLPLIFVRLIKSRCIKHLLNEVLFDRASKDVFESFYKANNVKDIMNLLRDNFEIVELFYNYDPAYVSFNSFTYGIGKFIYKMTDSLGLKFLKPHIIGVFKNK